MGDIESMRQHVSKVGAAICVFASLSAGPALATEGGASLYIPGLRGPLSGLVPPPGFYFQNDFYSYSGSLPGSRRLQLGGAVLSDVKVEARVNFLTPTWVTPLEVLGGNLGFAVTLPFGVPRISAGAVVAAPRLGRAFAFKQRDATFNIGDPVVTSFIGWHSGNFHWTTGVAVNIPAGAYQEGQLSNVALNRWIGDLYGAVTYLNTSTGLEISAAGGFEINGTNNATDYNSGNAIHADFSISQYLSKDFSIGVQVGHYQQVSGDSGSGASLGPFKGRTTAIGGTIGYNFEVGGVPISTRLKVLREVGVENRPRGTIGLFTVAFPLGGQSAPAAPKSTIVKH